jgi:BRCT domain type II-containing protein
MFEELGIKIGYGVVGEESPTRTRCILPTLIIFDTTEAGPQRIETLSELKIAYFDSTNFQILFADMHGGIGE